MHIVSQFDRCLPDAVKIEGSGATHVKCRLHLVLLDRGVVNVVEPVGVHGAGSASEYEREAGAGIVSIEYTDLGGNRGIPNNEAKN